MRQHPIATLCTIVVLLVGTVSCTGSNNKSGSASTAEAVPLPELTEGQTVVLENDTLRIVEYIPDGSDQNTYLIQPKLTGFASFEVEPSLGYMSYETKTPTHLILTEGTSVVCELQAFDLLTGKMVGKFEGFINNYPIEVEDDNRITFYAYREEYPQAQWDPETREWSFLNDVPEHLRATVKELDAEIERSGASFTFPAMAYRKIRMHLDSGRIEELDEYKWGYMQ